MIITVTNDITVRNDLVLKGPTTVEITSTTYPRRGENAGKCVVDVVYTNAGIVGEVGRNHIFDTNGESWSTEDVKAALLSIPMYAGYEIIG